MLENIVNERSQLHLSNNLELCAGGQWHLLRVRRLDRSDRRIPSPSSAQRLSTTPHLAHISDPRAPCLSAINDLNYSPPGTTLPSIRKLTLGPKSAAGIFIGRRFLPLLFVPYSLPPSPLLALSSPEGKLYSFGSA